MRGNRQHNKNARSVQQTAGLNVTAGLANGVHRNGNDLPERYTIKVVDGERVLICLEAPNLNVHMEPGLTVSASVAHKSPAGTIFLDGVAACEPFMNHERQVYNLDHHEGCVRAFTLATCEQALVMHLKGLDLRSREWNIFANEPDLDTILAVWILLNHARLDRPNSLQRRILFALVRLEGVIDALGLELKELSALPPELMRKLQRVIDHLRHEEVALKKDGLWAETDHLAYTIRVLHKIDQIIYKASDFTDFMGIGELARIELSEQRIAAVVEADLGIYEIESHLQKLYGNRLGVVFLKKGNGTYTVRQMDLFMPITLDDIYEKLNFIDPAVKCRTDTNKWGGSGDIGGSPRETGTLLSPQQIAQACHEAVQRPGPATQAYRFGMNAAMVASITLCAYIIAHFWQPGAWFSRWQPGPFWQSGMTAFGLSLIILSGAVLVGLARCRLWQYGLISPVGRQWWALLMPVVLAGWFGGAVLGAADSESLMRLIGEAAFLALGVELLFRSLVHGLLAQSARIQRKDTPWFVSWPAVGSALLYTGFYLIFRIFPPEGPALALAGWPVSQAVVGALAFGLLQAMVRERSQSVWTVVMFSFAAAIFMLGMQPVIALALN